MPCLLPSKSVEAPGLLGLDYKDYENLPNLFPQRDGLMLGKTRYQQGRSSGGDCGCPVQSYIEGVHEKKMPSKKVWEKFVAFVVKCREARKHQESRRQWTRLQPGYDRSLQSSIPFRGNSVHFRVRGDWWKNVAKKVWKKFVAFVVKCREARKHLASWWLWTGLQTDYDRSL